MPVSAPQPPCLHCQECGRRECCLVFRVQLDADLLHTLVSIYPEWFGGGSGGGSGGIGGGGGGGGGGASAANMQPVSPPKAEVDDSPLHQAMDKNKESLKVKLMLRRPINQLVAQGIMPPLKTPPAFHEQRQKLERAKMGDLLKAKIQQRPDRQELVRQHILEDVGHVDPSLAERQRQLKKCRLADALNDQLSHRPGPLELIKKNILHTDEPIERAVKEGHIEFKATSEGQSTKPTPPNHYVLDEDSSSGGSPPRELVPTITSGEIATLQIPQQQQVAVACSGTAGPVTASGGGGIVTVLLTPTAAIALPTPGSVLYTTAAAPTPSPSSVSTGSAPSTPRPSPAPGKDKNRKKSKAKAQPKARTIKFHEYKGPPNAQKASPQSSSAVETPYELLLHQQQLFLQWQLEWQHKYPQIILPASQKPTEVVSPPSSGSSTSSSGGSCGGLSPAPPPPAPPPLPQSPPPHPPPHQPLRNLEDMKVSDLKAELKRRNLPVSGAKPQLIERLKPFSESAQNAAAVAAAAAVASVGSPATSGGSSQQQLSAEEMVTTTLVLANGVTVGGGGNSQIELGSPHSVSSPLSSPPPQSPPAQTPTAAVVAMETADFSEGIIIREQQRRIDQLQRQLINSQLQLQNTFQGSGQMSSAKASLAAFLQQQQLNQALLQQQQQVTAEAITNNNNTTTNNNNNNNNNGATTIVLGGVPATIMAATQKQRTTSLGGAEMVSQAGVLTSVQPTTISMADHQAAALINQINQIKVHQHNRTGSLPNFIGTFVNGQADLNQSDLNSFIDSKQLFDIKPELKMEGEDVKSQIVDDVLEILIKNGELPASAADGIEPELDALDGMEVDQDLMDVDTDWLDSLMDHHPTSDISGSSHCGGSGVFCGDPLLAPHVAASPPEPVFMDLFMDDTADLKMPTSSDFCWDRIDYAT